ncbi:cytidine deaminase [Lagierella sp.]|uniref:cytidine deaminase n=1 Tax=Lagierella sp. TaxID=2849657 RepID=UPI002619758E|nr:cytidine deaminase [Lagierella sp.]
MLDSLEKELILEAMKIRKNSYSPYSKYAVGAAILGIDGKIYTGANVENASYGATICAERSAATNACSRGVRTFTKIAIVGGPNNEGDKHYEFSYPCGICRQFLNEFCSEDMEVIVAKDLEEYRKVKFKDLLAFAFGPKNLE